MTTDCLDCMCLLMTTKRPRPSPARIGFPTGEDGTGGGDPELVYDCLTRVRLSCFHGAHSELVRAGVLRVTIAAMKAHMKSDASVQIVACEVRVIVLVIRGDCPGWPWFWKAIEGPSKAIEGPSKAIEGASAESPCCLSPRT